MQLSQNEKKIAHLFLHFRNLYKILDVLKKRYDPQRLFVSQIIDCKRSGYLSAEKASRHNTYEQSTC